MQSLVEQQGALHKSYFIFNRCSNIRSCQRCGSKKSKQTLQTESTGAPAAPMKRRGRQQLHTSRVFNQVL
eukprot:4640058-Amphidinium_carterae.1